MKKILLLLLVFPVFGFGQTTELIISEYAEGSGGNKKYIEIFNGTGAAVNLDEYQLKKANNGGGFTVDINFTASTILANNTTWIIANNAIDVPINNQINSNISHNGDDAYGLFKNIAGTWTLIDIFGTPDTDPGTGWSVAGTANATVDKILVRKSSVCSPTTDWSVSSGIDAASSQWLIAVDPYNDVNQPQPTASNHTVSCIPGCNISASGLTNTTCNDAGTSSDPVDDYITFDLDPTGADLGTTYTVSVPTGTITPTTGTYGAATSFELQGGSAGAGNVTVTITDDVDGGCTFDQVITDPGVCSSATPDITVNPTLLTGFTHIVGTPSAEQTFTVSGLALTNDIVLTAPTNYEISLTTATGFTNTLNLTPSTGTVASTIIYVRENAASLGIYNETITITSTGATDEMVNLEGTANDYVDFTIDEINDLDGNGVGTALNTLVELTGVVHCMDFDGNAGYSLTIIDNSGKGINVFKTTDLPNYTNPMSGDSILVRGVILQFNGLLEVEADSINLLASGVELVTPAVVTTLDESTESNYITLENLTFVTPITNFPTGSNNINVTDGINTYVLRVDSDTDIPGSVAPQFTFNVTGVGGQFDSSSPYDSGYQLFPCGTSSFVPSCSTPDVSVSVAGFTITAATTGATITYQWIDCDDNSEINGETSASFTPTVDGDYAVIITDEVCADTSVCTTIAGLSIAKNELSSVVNVYPNPVQNELTISNTSTSALNVQVLDINGKVIFETTSNSAKMNVETTSWNKGVYFVQISNGNATITHKIVK